MPKVVQFQVIPETDRLYSRMIILYDDGSIFEKDLSSYGRPWTRTTLPTEKQQLQAPSTPPYDDSM